MTMSALKFSIYFISVALLQRTSVAYSTSKQSSHDRRSFFKHVGTAATSALVYTATSRTLPAWAEADVSELKAGGNIQFGDESIMAPKAHGTSEKPVQESLKYNVSNQLADKISNYNRRFAEMGGYFESTTFEETVRAAKGPITYYDSVTGKPLFVAPINRSVDDFIKESQIHG